MVCESLDKARTKFGFDLWAWVVMPDHAHILLWPKVPGTKTAGILHAIKSHVGRKAINYLRKSSPAFLQRLKLTVAGKVEYHFWQDGPGHDRNVNEPKIIHEQIDYSHNNPVKKGLVEKAEDWRWSSAQAWAGDPNPILKIDRDSVPSLVN